MLLNPLRIPSVQQSDCDILPFVNVKQEQQPKGLPIHIDLPFEETVADLLRVKPEPVEKKPQAKKKAPKKGAKK